MKISRMLGATMIAGALATGGAAAGIADAATTTTPSSTAAGSQGTAPPSSSTTPAAPSQSQKSGAGKGNPCPNMGTGTKGSANTAPGAPAGATAQ